MTNGVINVRDCYIHATTEELQNGLMTFLNVDRLPAEVSMDQLDRIEGIASLAGVDVEIG